MTMQIITMGVEVNAMEYWWISRSLGLQWFSAVGEGLRIWSKLLGQISFNAEIFSKEFEWKQENFIKDEIIWISSLKNSNLDKHSILDFVKASGCLDKSVKEFLSFFYRSVYWSVKYGWSVNFCEFLQSQCELNELK